MLRIFDATGGEQGAACVENLGLTPNFLAIPRVDLPLAALADTVWSFDFD
jgi:hypothetical protein